MKNKALLILPVLLASVFALSFLSAASTDTLNFTSPKPYYNYTGTLNFSARTNAVVAAGEAHGYNVSLYCNTSGGTIESTTGADIVKITTIQNSSEDQVLFENAAVSITSLTEGATYNCSAYSDNVTDQTWANTGTIAARSITIDSTNPSVAITRAYNNVKRGSNLQLTYTISDSLDSSPTNVCTVTKVNGDTVSITSSPFTLDAGDLNFVGLYTYTCTSTDYTGNSASDSETFTVTTDSNDDNPPTNNTLLGLSSGTFLMIIIAGAAGVAMIIVIFLLAGNNKGNKGRRKSRRKRR